MKNVQHPSILLLENCVKLDDNLYHQATGI